MKATDRCTFCEQVPGSKIHDWDKSMPHPFIGEGQLVSSKAAEAAGGEKWAIDRLKQAAHWLCDQPHHVGFLESCTVCKTNLMALKSAYDMGREQSAPAAPSERADEEDELLLVFMEEWTKETLGDGLATMREKAAYQAGWQARLSSQEGK